MEVTSAGAEFIPMKLRTAPYKKRGLWELAMEISRQSGGAILPPDRTARRMKDALTCWFCRWVPQFPAGFSGLPTRKSSGRQPPRKRVAVLRQDSAKSEDGSLMSEEDSDDWPDIPLDDWT
jgi:hypothetical protein